MLTTRRMLVAAAVGVFLGVQALQAEPTRPPDPDYAWTFDDGTGAVASAAYGNVDGSVMGGAAWSANGRFGYLGNGSLEFSGVITGGQEVRLDDAGGSDKISINDAGANNAFTVSAWIYDRDTSLNDRANIFGNWFSSTQNVMLWSEQSSTYISLEVREQNDQTNGTLTRSSPQGQWAHVVGVWDGAGAGTGTGRLYINNTATTIPNAGILESWASEDTYYVGGDSRGNSISKNRNRMFNGFIDEVAVWKRALGADEVAWLNEHSISGQDEPPPREPLFTFAQISDVHVGNDANLPTHTRLQAAVTLINSLQPNFVIDTGDMTSNPVHGATEANFAEYTQYKQYIDPLTMPIYFVPGNHDIGFFNGENDPRGIAWGDYDALTARFEQELGPLNQSFTFGGARFILMNNNAEYSRQPGHLTPQQLAWIEQELQDGRVSFLFGHVPVLQGGTGAPWGSSAEDLVALINQHEVALVTYGHDHNSIQTVRDAALYNMAPDLKNAGQQSIYLYKIFADDLELWSYDVLTQVGTLVGTFALPQSLTWPVVGDANEDGLVDDSDLSLLLASWGQDADWAGGNFNEDNVVDDADLSLLLASWTGLGSAGGTVPEPCALSLLALGWLGLRRGSRPKG